MNSILNLTAKQLRKAAGVKEKIDRLLNDVNRLLGGAAGGAPRKRRLSAAAIARIRAGVKARWARIKGRSGKPARKAKRRMSAAGRARLAALARARWRVARAKGKTTL